MNMDAALLDTDILSEILKRKNLLVAVRATSHLKQHGAFTFSAMTRYEVVRGLKEKSAAAKLVQFGVIRQNSHVLPVSDAVLDRATDLWVLARSAGVQANDADLIIAATALEAALVLATGNTAHFEWIPGLRIEDWRVP
jgi:tRNA(fMet)-specific endonuclease VapC